MIKRGKLVALCGALIISYTGVTRAEVCKVAEFDKWADKNRQGLVAELQQVSNDPPAAWQILFCPRAEEFNDILAGQNSPKRELQVVSDIRLRELSFKVFPDAHFQIATAQLSKAPASALFGLCILSRFGSEMAAQRLQEHNWTCQ